MPELVISDEQAIAHLNLAPATEVDEDLALKMAQAQAIVYDYITDPDATWTVDTVPEVIRAAILLQLGELYVYRGECHRRQGELDPARRDLQTAVRNSPERLSAWINLALLDGEPQAVDDAERRCRTFAPLLMDELSDCSATERLEGMLAAMRGNRRSTPVHMTYHLWGRLWHRAAGGN